NSNKKVLIIGSAVIDVIVDIPAIPNSGEDVFAKSDKTIVGGCAYNVGNILRQFNSNYDLMIPIGNGSNGKLIKNQMGKDGHNQLLDDLKEDNGWSLCLVEESGERTFLTVPGIESKWEKEWFRNINIDNYDYIYLSGYSFESPSAEVLLEALQFINKHATIIFDPSPRVAEMDANNIKSLLKMKTIIHANQDEILKLSKEKNAKNAAIKINKQTSQPVVVTLGSEGTLIAQEGEVEIFPVKKGPVADTIGAGHSHTAAFIAALLDSQSIETAGTCGNELAS